MTSSGSWHDELVLITDLARVNKQISAYVLRALDADAERAKPTSPTDEHALGACLVELGTAMQARAERRAFVAGTAGKVVIDATSADTHPGEQ